MAHTLLETTANSACWSTEALFPGRDVRPHPRITVTDTETLCGTATSMQISFQEKNDSKVKGGRGGTQVREEQTCNRVQLPVMVVTTLCCGVRVVVVVTGFTVSGL